MAALTAAAGAQAETLPVAGLYAAETDAPSRVQTITIAGFAGRGGERVACAIDTALRSAIIEGQPWFAVSFSAPLFGNSYRYDRDADPAAVRGGAEAVMRGIADVEWDDVASGTKEIEECAARNERGKCIERKKVNIPCLERRMAMRPEVRLVARNGDLLYATADTLTLSRRFCEDDNGPPPVDLMIGELAEQFADGVRLDLAPIYQAEGIRLLESRSGIARADHPAFRDALRLTNTDVVAACDAFAALEANNPSDIKVLFNIGLFHKSSGDLESAARIYDAVLAISPRKLEPQEGLARIASRARAERQRTLRSESQATR
ncbi:MAG: tetratricopeptide repeat protein [Erythrobacter sp.]